MPVKIINNLFFNSKHFPENCILLVPDNITYVNALTRHNSNYASVPTFKETCETQAEFVNNANFNLLNGIKNKNEKKYSKYRADNSYSNLVKKKNIEQPFGAFLRKVSNTKFYLNKELFFKTVDLYIKDSFTSKGRNIE
jgi:hypothetical protein